MTATHVFALETEPSVSKQEFYLRSVLERVNTKNPHPSPVYDVIGNHAENTNATPRFTCFICIPIFLLRFVVVIVPILIIVILEIAS